jgi:hypothetical protein
VRREEEIRKERSEGMRMKKKKKKTKIRDSKKRWMRWSVDQEREKKN